MIPPGRQYSNKTMNQEIRNIDELIVELKELIEDYIMQMESHISGKDSS
ncbi:MAG: hypothetical protein HUJ75_04980, partial [Parasporobacterium sp.]|nr:hypothetical protein [Parasporobacterium sp.]